MVGLSLAKFGPTYGPHGTHSAAFMLVNKSIKKGRTQTCDNIA